MRILLTNDDGIHAPGLWAIYRKLTRLGTVTVVAPDSERSSVGHGITLSRPIWVKTVHKNRKLFGYGISGTPADCVKFGVTMILKRKPDVIVSGINRGPNEGASVFYSGTIAGAREGALMGIPSLALSLDEFITPDFSNAAVIGAKLTKAVFKNGLPTGTFLNVNIPNLNPSKIKGVVFTRQGIHPIHEVFLKRQGPNERTYYWMTGRQPKLSADNGIDTNALRRHYVTVTPIQCDTTNEMFLPQLKTWKI